ncbi:unnamed protein product [Protopolystoma xenopodis]|uniref:Thioredoxin domain-containing protein n=1 Tax=Protopolystoma xenopodis TaxID=117903 RepID=A0A3S4ZW53_9PLAT|nr:unnamed protein product [Protopolystoma xenopodis]
MQITVRSTTLIMEFEEIISSAGDKLVVVDFFGAWCGPCKQFAPLFEDLSSSMPDIIFCKVNVDECPQLKENT